MQQTTVVIDENTTPMAIYFKNKSNMLNYWVEVGLISKWEEVKEGRSFVAVKVTVKQHRKAITDTAKS